MLFFMFLKTFFTQDVKNQVLLTNMWLSLVCQIFFIPFRIPDFLNSTFRFPDPFCYDFLHEIFLCTYVAESFYILMFTITIKGAWIRRWTLFFDWLAADMSASWHKWLPETSYITLFIILCTIILNLLVPWYKIEPVSIISSWFSYIFRKWK